MLHPLVREADPLELLHRTLPLIRLRESGIEERQGDIVHEIILRKQVVLLEDEADLMIPDGGELVVCHVGGVDPLNQILSLRRHIEGTDDVHEGRLARTGLADDGDEFPMVDVYADTVVRMHLLGTHLVDFANVFELQERHLPVMLRRDIGTGCTIDALGRLRGPQLRDFLVIFGVFVDFIDHTHSITSV